MTEARRVGILSLSPILDDPRVRRQADALHEVGYCVTVFGLAGGRSAPPPWTLRTTEELRAVQDAEAPPAFDQSVLIGVGAALASEPRPAARLHRYRRAWGWLRPRIAAGLRRIWPLALRVWPGASRSTIEQRLWSLDFYARLAAIRFDSDRADELYWTLGSGHADLLSLAQGHRADFWIANDWNTLPVAALIAECQGVPFFYDSHELAYDEHGESWSWSRFLRPAIFAIENKYIRAASAVTAVSAGIARRLQDLHRLPARPTLVRNMPRYQETTFRPAGPRVSVLYHGIIVPGRGIEACIRSAALWRPEFELTVRGPISDEYRIELEALIRRLGLASRVHLAPPVATDALVAEASRFDVGLFALPGHSHHNVFALPNKIFEYAMAGLCLCVSAMPEMTQVVQEHDMGVVMAATTPKAIAAAINGLDAVSIDRFKTNALVAARALCWDAERSVMLDLYERALSIPRPAPPRKLQQPLLPPEHARLAARIRSDELECPEYWRTDGAALLQKQGSIEILTPPHPWRYAVSALLNLTTVDFMTEDCWIEVQLDEAEGGLAVSLYAASENLTHFEQSIPVMKRPGSVWLVPTHGAGDLLMFRTDGAGVSGRAVFREARLIAAPKRLRRALVEPPT